MLEVKKGIRDTGQTRSLRLEWQGQLPYLWARVALTLFLVPFLLGPVFILVGLVVQAQARTVDLIAAPLFLAFWYGFVYAFGKLAGRLAGRWSSVEWDTDQDALLASFKGHLLWFTRVRRIPFHDLTGVSYLFGADSEKDAPTVCRITYLDGPDATRERMLLLPLFISGLNRRDEVMDIALRTARALRWEAYHVPRSDDLRLEVRLLRSLRDHENGLPIPELASEPDYHADRVAERIVAPALVLPAFDPAMLSGPATLREWSPGTRVRLEKRNVSRLQLTLAVTVLTIVVSLPIAATIFLASDWPWRYFLLVPALEAPVLGVLIGMLVWKQAREEREVTLDWEADRVELRADSGSHTFPLRQIRRLAVRGESVQVRSSHNGEHLSTHTKYRCRIVAALPGREEKLVETHLDGDPDVPYLACAAMARELAESLGVAWEWEGYDAR